jgi:hypothetical protein
MASTDRRPDLRLGVGVDQYAGHVITASAGAPLPAGPGTLTIHGGGAYRQRDGFALGGDVSRRDGAPVSVGAGIDPGQPDDPDLRTNSDLRQIDAFTTVRYDGAGGAHVGLTASGYRARRGVPPELHLVTPRLWRYPDVSRVLTIVSAGSGPVRTPAGHGSVSVSGGLNAGALERPTPGPPSGTTSDWTTTRRAATGSGSRAPGPRCSTRCSGRRS